MEQFQQSINEDEESISLGNGEFLNKDNMEQFSQNLDKRVEEARMEREADFKQLEHLKKQGILVYAPEQEGVTDASLQGDWRITRINKKEGTVYIDHEGVEGGPFDVPIATFMEWQKEGRAKEKVDEFVEETEDTKVEDNEALDAETEKIFKRLKKLRNRNIPVYAPEDGENGGDLVKTWTVNDIDLPKRLVLITRGDIEGTVRIPFEEFIQWQEDVEKESTPEGDDKKLEVVIPERISTSTRFEEEFSITEEELRSIEGFTELSQGQQLLVLENLKQITLGRIQEEAHGAHTDSVKKTNLFGKFWKGITKEYQIAKQEKRTAKEIMQGGIATHKDVLVQLVNGMRETGIDAIEKDGVLEVQYVSSEGLADNEKKYVDALNEKATAFSTIPYEWSLSTASKENRKKYTEAEEAYKDARGAVPEGVAEKVYGSPKRVEQMLAYNALDRKIHLQQYLTAHPNVEKELENIQDASLLKRAFATVLTERGVYAGAGFITRTMTTALLGAVAVPLTVGVIGGIRARGRARELLNEREGMARRGHKDESKTAKNIIEGTTLSEKLEKAQLRLEEAVAGDDVVAIQKAEESFSARLHYTEKKITDGHVDFGDISERTKGQYALLQQLGQGYALLHAHMEDGVENVTKTEGRVLSFLETRAGTIAQKEKAFVRKEVLKGAVLSAGFAGAGMYMRHLGEEFLGWDTPGAQEAEDEAGSLEAAEKARKALLEKRAELDHNAFQERVDAVEPPPIAEAVFTVEKGDTTWGFLKRNLTEQGVFDGLEEGRQVYIVDVLKDTLESMSPEELKTLGIGSGDIDLIQVGEKVNLSKVLDDMGLIEEAEVNARALTEEQVIAIENFSVSAGEVAPEETVGIGIVDMPMEGVEELADAVLDTEDMTETLHAVEAKEVLEANNLTEDEHAEPVAEVDSVEKLAQRRMATEIQQVLGPRNSPEYDKLWDMYTYEKAYDVLNPAEAFAEKSGEARMQEYLDLLSKESGLKPRRFSIFFRTETVQDFVLRANEKITELERIRNK